LILEYKRTATQQNQVLLWSEIAIHQILQAWIGECTPDWQVA